MQNILKMIEVGTENLCISHKDHYLQGGRKNTRRNWFRQILRERLCLTLACVRIEKSSNGERHKERKNSYFMDHYSNCRMSYCTLVVLHCCYSCACQFINIGNKCVSNNKKMKRKRMEQHCMTSNQNQNAWLQ